MSGEKKKSRTGRWVGLFLAFGLIGTCTLGLFVEPETGKEAAKAVKEKVNYNSKISVRLEAGSMGMNVVVENAADIPFHRCKIYVNGTSFKLRKDTILDANGHRAYPFQLFVNKTGKSPSRVTGGMIDCSKPKLLYTFGN